MKTGRLREKRRKVSEAVVPTKAGPEPRHQTRDKADGVAGCSRAEGGAVAAHTPQAGKQRPRGKKEQALRYLKEVKHSVQKVRGVWCQRTWVRVSVQFLILR